MSRHRDEQKRVHVNKYAGERPNGPTLAEIAAADPAYIDRQLAKAREQRDKLNRPPVPPTPPQNPIWGYNPYGARAYRMSGW